MMSDFFDFHFDSVGRQHGQLKEALEILRELVTDLNAINADQYSADVLADLERAEEFLALHFEEGGE